MHSFPYFDKIAYLTALSKFQADNWTEKQAALSHVNDGYNGSLYQRKSGVSCQRPQKIQCDWTQWTRVYNKRAFHILKLTWRCRYSHITQGVLLSSFK